MKFVATAVAVASFLSSAHAHDDHKTDAEVEAYKHLQESAYHCAPKIAAYTAQRKRAAQQALGGAPTDASTMFLDDAFESAQDAGKTQFSCSPLEEARIRNHTCVLSPEVTQGPYYHVGGHPIRQNMAEDQLGLLFVRLCLLLSSHPSSILTNATLPSQLMDVGIIDVKTCEPVPNILVDLWHANTTGHYAGHADPDPDLFWEGPAPYGERKGLLTKFPRWNTHETWLRGAWPTNKNGVAQFTTIFPGYYTGRATHVHSKIHTEWEPHTNGSFTSGRLIHTGQLFVDDELNGVIDKIHPYTTNPIKDKWGRTRNWDDSLKVYQKSHRGGFGPTFEIEKIGGVLQQGLIGYITLGVDLSNDLVRDQFNQGDGVSVDKPRK